MPTLSSAFPVAAKPHTCMTCLGPIRKGDRYYYWTGTDRSGAWDGVATLKECPRCARRYSRSVDGRTLSDERNADA